MITRAQPIYAPRPLLARSSPAPRPLLARDQDVCCRYGAAFCNKRLGQLRLVERSEGGGGGAAGGPTGEQAAAEERALQRVVTVHPATAEPGHLARGVQAHDRLAVRGQRP